MHEHDALSKLRAIAPKDMTDEQLVWVNAQPLQPGLCGDCLAWFVACLVERGDRILAQHKELMAQLECERMHRAGARVAGTE